MCDPMVAGVIGAVASAGSALMSSQAQASAMRKQEEANAQWIAYQKKSRAETWANEERLRAKAEAARQNALQQVTPDEQKKAQTAEETRVQQDIAPKDMVDTQPQLIGDKLLQGQKGGDQGIVADIGSRITQASRDARARIAALSTIQSYGGSQFGLQNRAQDIFNQSGQDIRLAGDERSGNLAAGQVAMNVEPAKITSSPSPWGGIASSLAGLAGKAFTAPSV